MNMYWDSYGSWTVIASIILFALWQVQNDMLHVWFSQVGLAVDDIKGIQEAATLKRLAMRVRAGKSKFACLFSCMHVYFHLPAIINFIVGRSDSSSGWLNALSHNAKVNIQAASGLSEVSWKLSKSVWAQRTHNTPKQAVILLLCAKILGRWKLQFRWTPFYGAQSYKGTASYHA